MATPKELLSEHHPEALKALKALEEMENYQVDEDHPLFLLINKIEAFIYFLMPKIPIESAEKIEDLNPFKVFKEELPYLLPILRIVQKYSPAIKVFGDRPSIIKSQLSLATIFGEATRIDGLLGAGHALDPIGNTEPSPLQVAVVVGNLYLVREYLGAGAKINYTTSAGESALQLAIKTENPEMINLLLDKISILKNTYNQIKSTLQCQSSRKEDSDNVSSSLIEDEEALKLLLEVQELFPILKTFEYRTSIIKNPLSLATIFDEREDIDELLQKMPVDPIKNEPSPLQIAVVMRNLYLTKKYLEKGADINYLSDPEGSALHWAVKANTSGMLYFLLNQAGIEVNCRDKSLTPLGLAIKLERKGSADILLDSNKVNLRSVTVLEHNEIFLAIKKRFWLGQFLDREDFEFREKEYEVLDPSKCPEIVKPFHINRKITRFSLSPYAYSNALNEFVSDDGRLWDAIHICSAEDRYKKREAELITTYFNISNELRQDPSFGMFFSFRPLQNMVAEYLAFHTNVEDIRSKGKYISDNYY